jgi:3D (Asp-Asp-Asp) domain-containing protein
VLLGAQSLDEMVSALDGLYRLATQDKDILAQLARAKTALRDASARLAARQAELRSLLADARASRSAIAAARDARASYLAGLRRRQSLNREQIAHLTAQASAAEERSAEIAAGSGASGGGGGGSEPSVPPPPPAHGTEMTVSSTGYCLRGNTATGVPASHGVVAVDPSVIPLGTAMFVPGYGEGVAADTGAAVVGHTIDLWFSSCEEAVAWGRRTVTVTLH